MAQKNRIQDGTIVFSTGDPDTYDLGFNIQGNANITKALVVAQDNLSDSIIASSTGSDLEITVQPGAVANVRIYPPADGGNVLINNIAWVNNTPNLGGFIGASSTNVLHYYPFIAGNEVSDILTVSYLNTTYPNITPGQMVIGSNVVYLSVGLGTWRILNSYLIAFSSTLVVTGTSRTLPGTDAGKYLRFTNIDSKLVTVSTSVTNTEINIRNVSGGILTLVPDTGITLNAPAYGSLIVPPGGTITVKWVSAVECDIIGVTV